MTAGAVSAPLIIPIIHRHRAKNHIDTNTPVSIQSDTPGVLIFYSLDGSRPAAAQRGPAGSSRKYSEPVLLPAGRVSVRAVAVTSDGRESSTVTKVFSVELVDSNLKENVDDLLQSDQQSSAQRPSEGTSSSAESPAGSSLRPPEPRMMGNISPKPGPRFLNGRLGSPNPAAQTQRSPSASSGALKQLSSTQTARFIRETNLLRCVQCLSVRPSDPLARFCAQCGAAAGPLAAHRRPPADGGQAVCCVICNTLVSVNTHICLICEEPVHQQATHTLQDHVVCVSCGSGNPAHISSCLTCESRLQPPVCVEDSAPSVRSADSRMLSCSRCKRVNRRDARFCDWCGSKPGHAARCVICCRCGASGDPYAFFCTACGIFLEAPAPPTSYGDIRRPVGGAATKRAAATPAHDVSSQATPSSGPAPRVRMTTPTAEQCTQTVGLYYPSSTELQRKEKQRARELSRQQAPRDGRQLLTAVSPGRGYWRRQLDHVCGHLRSYTQNNAPFRALLGEPRLGRMVSAVIQEDRYEVSVTVSFVSAGREENQVDPAADGVGLRADRTETLSSITERSSDSSGLRSDASTGVMKPPKPNLAPKPPVKDLQLLKELGPGRGQISTIQQLLDQGADPTCCGGDGRHALAVAVVNGHHDVLPVLVQRGADVDEQSGQMKNSALHEAAARGSEGLQCAKVLLSCKASVRRRNAEGQTAYDVAVRSGCNNMVSLLAAQTGLDLLGKLGKPKLNLDVF
ncbi:double zinc ribbon and ankyrin repeat-containing protein 1-like isoform X1 [Sparus aurata]|uniref:double zinc ribbon and ankyrin repeat-containing protein 1-like isoform X1 n=2 Tax=Sparus aurata TaxID=8175 RepID=UPI0011C184F2|nr:double zinc ribbon and ankyrin repeat-containing protein 1-like isoform X1 [Sparus aurata]XP_030275120.1 double zinc ribbon and ankyrin repeat-containing protein 1-like isoform X1 [Sparus aurata]